MIDPDRWHPQLARCRPRIPVNPTRAEISAAAQLKFTELRRDRQATQPLGQMTVIEPAPVPLRPIARARNDQDRGNHHEFEDDQNRLKHRRKRQPEQRKHNCERRKAEVGDIAAAKHLRDMRCRGVGMGKARGKDSAELFAEPAGI